MCSNINAKSAIILIVFLTSLVYANTLKNSFVWDDAAVIVENNFVKSRAHIPLLFTRDYLTPYIRQQDLYIPDLKKGSGETTYRPVVTASYFIDYDIWKLNPFGYHLTNGVLHIANALLLFCLANLLVKNRGVALLASLLFALHPVHNETVNVISFREDLLAFLFFTASFILAIIGDRYDGIKKLYVYAASLVSFLLALFSKEISVTLPFVLLLYDHFFGSRQGRRKFLARFASRYAGYVVVLMFYLWVRFIVMRNPCEPHVGYPGGSFYTNTITMLQALTYYIRWLFFPVGIPIIVREFQFSIAHSFLTPAVMASVSLILILLFAAIRLRRISGLISFSILYFFITLLPVSNVWPIVNFMASRYVYIPSIGFCLACAALLGASLPRGGPGARFGPLYGVTRYAGALLLVSCALLTVQRNAIWANDTTVSSEMVKTYPRSARLHASLGASFLKDKNVDKAIDEYRIAVRLKPDSALYHKGLGDGYCAKGMPQEAREELEKALTLYRDLPDLDGAYSNLGLAFEGKGLYKEAVNSYKKAAALNPNSAAHYFFLGNAHDKAKDYQEAIQAYQKAIALNPDYLEAYNNMASVYVDIGDIDNALSLWNKILRADPGFATAHFNLAVFYFRQKKFDLAIAHCDKVIALGYVVDPAFLELLAPHRK
jgi:Tfp pilus assembly protein PilF